MGAFVASPGDIRGNIIFLRGSFALCPGVFLPPMGSEDED